MFASLSIEELLLELVPNLNSNSSFRASIIQILRKTKLIGFHLSPSMTQNMIADYQMNGLNMDKIQLLANSVPFQVKVCGMMRKVKATGGQYLFMATIQIVMYTQELGMTIKMGTVSSLVLTYFSTLKTLESLLKEWLKLTKREFMLTLK